MIADVGQRPPVERGIGCRGERQILSLGGAKGEGFDRLKGSVDGRNHANDLPAAASAARDKQPQCQDQCGYPAVLDALLRSSSANHEKKVMAMAIQMMRPPPNFMISPAEVWSVWIEIPHNRGRPSYTA